MTSTAPGDTKGAIGYLQKKSRFYGWSKHVFLLNQQGLAQLSTERQPRSAKDQPSIRLSRDLVIGAAAGINLKHALSLKHKQFVGLSDIAHFAGQSTRELAVTSTAGILVLRAQSAAERDLWLEALQRVTQSVANANASAVAVSEVQSSPPSPIPDAESPIPTRAYSLAAASHVSREEQLYLLELTLASESEGQPDSGRLELGFIAPECNAEPASTMGWLPSIASFADPVSTEAPLSNAATDTPNALPDTQPDAEKLCLGPYTLPASDPETEPAQHDQSSAQDKFSRNSEKAYINMNAESFDADRFFDDNDSVAEVPPSIEPPLGAGSRSELPLTDGAPNVQAAISNGDVASALLIPSLAQPSQYKGIPPSQIGTDDAAFGDMFGDFLGTFNFASRERLHDHAMVEQQGADARGIAKLETNNASGASGNFPSIQPRGEDMRDSHDDSSSSINIPLGVASGKPNQDVVPAEVASGGQNAHSAVAVAANVTEPTTVINSSIADIATSFLDNVGLPNFSTLLSAADDVSRSAPPEADDDVAQDDKPLLRVAAEKAGGSTGSPELKPPAKVLDPPGQYGLGGQSMDKLKSTVSPGGLRAAHRAQLDDPPGFQMSLLSKYSDSLNSSRALLSNVSRVGRPKTMHDWQANTTKANTERGMGRAAAIVQYKATEPANTGVSKVVRGQLTKDIIQKEADRKPAVRRVRRAKSETKVPTLKAIRLKLDGSIVGSHVAANSSQASASRGLKYMVKDGRIEGAANTNGSRVSLAQAKGRTTQASHAAGVGGMGSGTQSNTDALGEFGEIQKRLRQAEEQKQLLQRARLLDKDASDGVRIADLIENRQDRPLAVQLEERRQMQVAKQQALMNQQLEQQRMQLEVQRLNMEQQQKYEQFKRQSLCPDTKSAHRMSTVSATQPCATNGWPAYGGSTSYTNQWVHSQNVYSSAVPSTSSFAHQHPSLCYQQPSRPVTPVSSYDPSMAWAQQQQQQQHHAPGRSFSQYTQTTAPSVQRVDAPARAVARSFSAGNPRRQAGTAFVNQARPVSRAALSEHSAASSGSWQSHVAHSTRTSIHAKTDPLMGGSVFVASPTLSAAVAKRTSSFGYADSRRSISSRPESQDARVQTMYAAENMPPVPPIPQHVPGGNMHYAYPASPAQGLPLYMQPAQHANYSYQQPPAQYGNWAAPPANAWNPPHAQNHAECHYQPGVDPQLIQRKRTEMTAKVPSLLQQLGQAQVSGIMPGRMADKPTYTQGAYQNANVPQVVRETSGAHYLGNGNTLLIDRVHESEKTKRAFLKKVSRNYTGVGGDSAPTPVFMR
ncbi:hypothetical protein IWW50_002549 [Coemansia erecta]|nr:hypothetical protein IWW50_002549 [Coemansia erecta]